MKTWMFVAEVMWLFIGMCIDPQSVRRTETVESCTSLSTTRTLEGFLKAWTVSGRVRPPPLSHWNKAMTIQ